MNGTRAGLEGGRAWRLAPGTRKGGRRFTARPKKTANDGSSTRLATEPAAGDRIPLVSPRAQPPRPRPGSDRILGRAAGGPRTTWGRSFGTSTALHAAWLVGLGTVLVLGARGDGDEPLLAAELHVEPTVSPRELVEREAVPEHLERPAPPPLEDPREPWRDEAEPLAARPAPPTFETPDGLNPPLPLAGALSPKPTAEEAELVPEQPATEAVASTTESHARPDEDPELLEGPAPPYPALARRRGWEGVVLCRIFVLADGSVERVDLERTSGHAVLDDAALEAVRGWRFRPGMREGLESPVEIVHRVVFRLRPAS